jgi:hypothetical protein
VAERYLGPVEERRSFEAQGGATVGSSGGDHVELRGDMKRMISAAIKGHSSRARSEVRVNPLAVDVHSR